MEKVDALWSIKIDFMCPCCKEDLFLFDFDIEVDDQDFPQPGFSRKNIGFKYQCPECDTEFLIDTTDIG